MTQIVSVYPNFGNKGGAQNVTLQLAHRLTNEAFPIVLTRTPSERMAQDYKGQACYKKLSLRTVLLFGIKDTLFISHDRKSTLFLMLVKRTIAPRLRVLHVAHSVYDNLGWATILPNKIIAVSEAVRRNLTDYFHIDSNRVRVIYNGIQDCGMKHSLYDKCEIINILFAAKVYPLKQQVAFARYAKGRIPNHIHFYFAGTGTDADALQTIIKGCGNMHYLGHIDIKANIGRFNYTFLFSQREGLPLTLIESCMYGLPMITNDLPAVTEVNTDNMTGFVYHDFESLVNGLTRLPFPDSDEYKTLSTNARKRYEALFTDERMVEAYKAVVNNCIK